MDYRIRVINGALKLTTGGSVSNLDPSKDHRVKNLINDLDDAIAYVAEQINWGFGSTYFNLENYERSEVPTWAYKFTLPFNIINIEAVFFPMEQDEKTGEIIDYRGKVGYPLPSDTQYKGIPHERVGKFLYTNIKNPVVRAVFVDSKLENVSASFREAVKFYLAFVRSYSHDFSDNHQQTLFARYEGILRTAMFNSNKQVKRDKIDRSSWEDTYRGIRDPLNPRRGF